MAKKVPVTIVACKGRKGLKQADSSEACHEARVGLVVNYMKSDLCHIFCS